MIKRFAVYYKPHMRLFLLDLFFAFSLAGIDLIFPLFSQMIIDDFIPNQQMKMIVIYSAVIFGLYIFRMACNYFMGYWGHVMGARIEYDMRSDLFRHIQSLPFKFFDENKTGQLMSRIINDLNEISELAHHGPEDLFISLIMILGSFIIMSTINIPLTFMVIVMVICMILYTVKVRMYMVNSFRNVRKKQADINAGLESSLSGIRLTKSFANEAYEVEKFDVGNSKFRNSKNKAFKAIGTFSAGTHFLADVMTLMVMSIGGVLVINGKMSFGQLMAFTLYTAFFMRPIRRLIQFTQQFQSGMSGFERFIELMDTESDIKDAEDAVEMYSVGGSIAFKSVNFKYEEDSEYVLDRFDLEIEKGKTVALVGPSGVGKTTLSKLIPRFYEVNEGSIEIDGLDIRDYSLYSLRKNIGIVQQDVFIFYGSIKENIAYGKPGASDEEVKLAARRANIDDFIMGLDDGYDTIVGERGIKLSGGQKQRLAIARVFLKNPPILILDEATSSLDNQNELAIQKSIETLAQSRTTIIIAHRLSTIKKSDEIIVLDDSGIIERGSHQELIQLEKVYCELFNAQFDGYIPDEVKHF